MKKLVVITGASSGFGAEMLKKFSLEGYPVLVLARRIDKLNELIKNNDLKNVMAKEVDVTNYNDFKEAILEAESKYGKVDLLINNAGIMLLGDVSKQSPNEWQKMLDVNVMGVLNGMQIVLNDMCNLNSGTIINVSSIAGRKTFLNHAAYCASKFGVHALSETIREEVSGSNVRVLTIAPGAAETELLSHTTSKEIKDGYNEWKKTMGGKSMDAKHVSDSVFYMYSLPQEVSIRELLIAPTKQDS